MKSIQYVLSHNIWSYRSFQTFPVVPVILKQHNMQQPSPQKWAELLIWHVHVVLELPAMTLYIIDSCNGVTSTPYIVDQ